MVARLCVDHVVCSRAERPLFAPVSFDLAAGRVAWLRGANGSGKTTLLRALAGLSKPDAGAIGWPEGEPRPIHLGHSNGLKDDLNVAEAVRFAIGLDGQSGEPSPRPSPAGGRGRGSEGWLAALERLGMHGHAGALVRTLSQGQRRRVALARLAAQHQPRVWLLDEPYDALDTSGIETLNALLAEHAARGGSIVLTSHLPIALASPVRFEVELQPPMVAAA